MLLIALAHRCVHPNSLFRSVAVSGALQRAKMTTSTGKPPVFHSLGLPLHMSAQPIDLTLIQLGQTSSDKAKNIAHARKSVLDVISASSSSSAKDGKNTRMVVLPECWNSPYGVQYFDTYAEDFGGLYEQVKAPLGERKQIIGAAQKVSQGLDETTAAQHQQEALVERWTVDGLGGKGVNVQNSPSETVKMMSALAKELGIVLVGGSIPERDGKSGKLYNTASVFDERGGFVCIKAVKVSVC